MHARQSVVGRQSVERTKSVGRSDDDDDDDALMRTQQQQQQQPVLLSLAASHSRHALVSPRFDAAV